LAGDVPPASEGEQQHRPFKIGFVTELSERRLLNQPGRPCSIMVIRAVIFEAKNPGAMALTRMFFGPIRRPNAHVMLSDSFPWRLYGALFRRAKDDEPSTPLDRGNS